MNSQGRNDLVYLLGSPETRQEAAIELIKHELQISRSAILPIVVLAYDDSQILLQTQNNELAEGCLLPVDTIVEHVKDNKSLLELIITTYAKQVHHLDISPGPVENSSVRDNAIQQSSNSVPLPIVDKVLTRLSNHTSVRLIGESASGKTVAAAQVSCQLDQVGWSYTWVDLSEPGQGTFSLLISLMRTDQKGPKKHLVVIDDSQANPSELRNIGLLLDQVRKQSESQICLIVIGWESAAENIRQIFPNTVQVNCYGDLSIPSLAEGILGASTSEEDIDFIRESCGGDLLVARLMAEYKVRTGKFPDQSGLASLAYKESTNDQDLDHDAVRLLYALASLSQFEIDAHKDFALSYSKKGLDFLTSIQCVRENADYLSVGHRTLAKLLLLFMRETQKDAIHLMEEPTQIAVKYLTTATPLQIVATLERLDVASLAYTKNDQHGATFLARAWESLTILVNYVEKETINDPTWRNNTGSAVFAAIALLSVGNSEYIRIVNYLNDKWSVSNVTDLPQPSEIIPTEHGDFIEIKKCMEEEEESGHHYCDEDKAKNIDFSKMHRMWVLGLLLGIAGQKSNSSLEIEEDLLEIAKNAQGGDGSFYPPRVPWVTARVLIGLSCMGESIRTSSVVRKGCEWLCRAHPEGPYRLGVWEPGTGRWNTTLGTTAMCVNALTRCGVPSTDPHVKAGLAYLKKKKNEWAMPGKEIDGAFAVETILAVEGRWRNVSAELNVLLWWIRQRDAWEGNVVELSSVSHDESCRIAQIASSLISIVWDTVKRELPLLLEGLSVSKYSINTDELDQMHQLVYDKLIERIEEIKRKIDEEIRSRVDVREGKNINLPTIEAEQEWWEEQKIFLRFIERAMHSLGERKEGGSKGDLIKIVEMTNSLGTNCYKNTWENILI